MGRIGGETRGAQYDMNIYKQQQSKKTHTATPKNPETSEYKLMSTAALHNKKSKHETRQKEKQKSNINVMRINFHEAMQIKLHERRKKQTASTNSHQK